jgi:hypothetical protein
MAIIRRIFDALGVIVTAPFRAIAALFSALDSPWLDPSPLPELNVELPRPLAKSRRVAIRQRPRDRDQQRPAEQRLAVISLDGLPAFVAGLPDATRDRVTPPGSEAAAEVASHERMFA